MTASERPVYRVRWLPGADTLLGTCHCGAERTAEDPVSLWEWLLAHPAGHRAPEERTAPLATATV
ncbi:hypothetical protein NE235_00805 [Actinoallomurus spadix]|uniref:Uncharacterized protein n=1 Tax=Actinoallomurus spadix TaxID=79912 RepID=A0ABP3GDE8_9ACTN|nr:hypothetical protein [Actinoallomurus spadix]MCO5984638.1 hypothetical protein [Actinoallomurus spadix]